MVTGARYTTFILVVPSMRFVVMRFVAGVK